MKFKVGDVISNGRLYRRVKTVNLNIEGSMPQYEVVPLRDGTENRGSFALPIAYVDRAYYLHTKLHELLLGLDTENDTVYNGEKEQT